MDHILAKIRRYNKITKFKSEITDRYPNANSIEKEEIESKFKRVGTAYETLKNEREDYDDFLQNPEQAYYKYYQYYRNDYESSIQFVCSSYTMIDRTII